MNGIHFLPSIHWFYTSSLKLNHKVIMTKLAIFDNENTKR